MQLHASAPSERTEHSEDETVHMGEGQTVREPIVLGPSPCCSAPTASRFDSIARRGICTPFGRPVVPDV